MSNLLRLIHALVLRYIYASFLSLTLLFYICYLPLHMTHHYSHIIHYAHTSYRAMPPVDLTHPETYTPPAIDSGTSSANDDDVTPTLSTGLQLILDLTPRCEQFLLSPSLSNQVRKMLYISFVSSVFYTHILLTCVSTYMCI